MLDMTRKPLFPQLGTKKNKKNENLFFPFGKCRIVPKNAKGTLWVLLTYIMLQIIKKTRMGDPFEILKC